jgi:tRNA(fMet)-specific endonuclease VapC
LGRAVAFDTTFLIDLQRERSLGDREGPAHEFLASEPDLEVHLPVVALGEFAEGFANADDPVLRSVRELHVVLPVDESTALAYGWMVRTLRQTGMLPGSNDLWIAASAMRHELPLVTGNARAFRRIDGLEVIVYR